MPYYYNTMPLQRSLTHSSTLIITANNIKSEYCHNLYYDEMRYKQ